MKIGFFLLLTATCTLAGDWPQLLGPDRNGVVKGAVVGTEEPRVLWDRSLGTGFSGPVVDAGRVMIFHRMGDEVLLECCDAATGVLLWRFSRPTDYVDSFGFDNGPRAVPAVADGRVFVYGADGRVDAVNADDGEPIWNRDLVADFDSQQGFFGRAGSPLVVGNKVFLTPGGSRDGRPAGVVALDASNGAPVWQSVDDEAGYSSPMISAEGSLICWMRNQLWRVEPESGDVLAQTPLRSSMDASVNASQPVLLPGRQLMATAGYGVGIHVFQAASLEPQWSQENLIDSHYSTPLFVDGSLYGFHGRQEMGQTLRCVDVQRREVEWESESVPGGTLIAVGDHLLVVTEEGELWVVRATPDKLDIVHRLQILRSGHRSQLAYADGVLFARDGRQLVAVQVK